MRAAILYLAQNHLLRFDWFLKTDDDTYVVLENLRLLLRYSSSSTTIYLRIGFGQNVHTIALSHADSIHLFSLEIR